MISPMLARFPLILFLLLLITGCSEASPDGLPMTDMKVGSKTYHLEIAADDLSRERGLMERDSMPADHGMIFVFPTIEAKNFWMKNTRFPLAIVFADASGKVVSTHQMKAYDLNNTSSDLPAKYAIELSAGEMSDNNVKAGDTLQLPQVVLQAKAK